MTMSDSLDPMMWAKRPKSQAALDLLIHGSKEGDKRLDEIHSGHLSTGVCDEAGKLLLRFDGVSWIKNDAKDCQQVAY